MLDMDELNKAAGQMIGELTGGNQPCYEWFCEDYYCKLAQ